MSKSNLKVVGEINPPDYRNPVKMLRNIANDIEAGKYGDVATIVVATFGDSGVETFGGGRDASLYACSYLFGCAHGRLLRLPFSGDVD